MPFFGNRYKQFKNYSKQNPTFHLVCKIFIKKTERFRLSSVLIKASKKFFNYKRQISQTRHVVTRAKSTPKFRLFGQKQNKRSYY